MQKVQPIPESILIECQKISKEQDGMEKMLTYLRENKFSIGRSIFALREILGTSLAEAKKIVHFSETWKPERPQRNAFHDELEREARKMQ